MMVNHILSTGITIRQNIRNAVRFVMFKTGIEGWEYATEGGTAFIIRYEGEYFGITAKHVLQSFEWRQIALTNNRFGDMVAGVDAVYYPSEPEKFAEGSDILDVAII